MTGVAVAEDAGAFLARVESFLMAEEALHTLSLGLVRRLATSGPLHEDDEPFLALAEQDGEVVGVMVRTAARRPLVVSRLAEDAVAPLVDAGASLLPAAVGVNGPSPSGERVASGLAARLGVFARQAMAMRIFRLDEVVPVEGVGGTLRDGRSEDLELMVSWIEAFRAEAAPDAPSEGVEAVERYLTRDDIGLCLWEVEGEPVSMVGWGGGTPNSERIGPVYTAPERRCRGYASAAVAAVSQRRLDAGRAFLTLFTDLSNPTSNHIYTEIGYRPVCDAEDWRFEPLRPGATVT